MMKARLAALAGATMLSCAGLVHAAVVPVKPSVAPSQAASAAASSKPVAAVEVVTVERAQVVQTTAMPAGAAVQVGTNTMGAGPATPSAMLQGKADPFSAYLMSAGQYVLDVGSFSSSRRASAPKISEVPLPGALWLFGSALVAFLAISGRRKF